MSARDTLETSMLWASYREESHSPGRKSDDRRIMDAVVERLRAAAGVEVQLFHPHELPWDTDTLPDVFLYMCEARETLDRLADWAARGVVMVNPVRGVLNTFRSRTIERLQSQPFFPHTRLVNTNASVPLHITLAPRSQVWVKRGDYHATCTDDVLSATGEAELASALARFRDRGITSVVLQDHVEGDLIKFYGVRDHPTRATRWFTWFYHADQTLRHFPVDTERLQRICEHGASRLDLEVFGGDVIVTATGEILAIDFNAWPSFALFRDEAADHIARHVLARSAGSATPYPNSSQAASR